MDIINSFDHQLMLLLNFDGGCIMDQFMYWLSYKWTLVPVYLLVIYALWRTKTSRRQFFIALLTALLIVVLCDQVSSGVIKPLVARLRPSHDPLIMDQLHYVKNHHGGSYGFVSSHACNTCGIAVFLWHLFKNRAVHITLVLWVALVSYSRIYLGVHFPGDILGGLVLGAVIGFLFTTLYKKQKYTAATKQRNATA